MAVRHRDTLAPVDVSAEQSIPATMPKKQIVECARAFLLDLLKHEVDEMFYKAGLGEDPHAPPLYVGKVVLPDPDLGKVSK